MTVEEFFDNFLNEEVNLKKLCDVCDGSNEDCDICNVTSRYKSLASNLQDKLRILPTGDEESKPSFFLTGSYRRHTMIRPPKDVDFFVVLDKSEYQDEELDELITPKKLLSRVQAVLKEIYDHEDVEIRVQRHSVAVIFSDGFSIDVIPAFESDDGKNYLISDVDEDTERYIVSNPKIHYQKINEVNEATSTNGKKRFKKVVRLLKHIKKKKFNTGKSKIRSFHFELLAAEILGKIKINSYAEAIYKFFSEASGYFDKSTLIDPANPDNKIDDYIDELDEATKDSIKSELDSLHGIAEQAIIYEEAGEDDKAIRQWELMFEAELTSKSTTPPIVVYSPPAKPWSTYEP